MIKEIWINLPVKNINRAVEFYTNIGFTLNPHYGNSETSASFIVGSKSVVLMLFNEETFQSFVMTELTDTSKSNEVLLSFDAESCGEIDEIILKAEAAGAVVYARPAFHDGWLYGAGFIDPDGHRWNPLFMDFSKMPK